MRDLRRSVTFEPPAGFTVGDLQWPLPTQFVQPGDIVGYGYEGTLMLIAEVTPPEKLEIGKDVRGPREGLLAQLPQNLHARQGGIERETPRRKAQRARQRGALRRMDRADAAAVPFPCRNSGAVRIALIPEIKIAVPWKTKPEKVEFFPAPPEDVLLDKATINTGEKQTVITFAARRTGPAGPAEFVECLVTYTLPDGARKGFPIGIPLPALSAPPAAK